MRARTAISTVVILAGCAALAWGIRSMLVAVIPLGGSCGDVGQPVCPDESVAAFGYVFGGVIAIVVGSLAGRSGAWVAVFPSIGIGSLLAAYELPAGDRTFPLVFGIPWLLVGVAGLALIPFGMARRARAMRIALNGTRAIGTVISAEDTGTRINGQPRVKVRYRIEPQDGTSVFEGTKTITVSLTELPWPGQRVPIVFDPADRTKFVVLVRADEGAPEEIRQFIAGVQSTGPVIDHTFVQRVAKSTTTVGPTVTVSGAGQGNDPITQLTMLNALRLSGALTEEEFQAQKARILGQT